MTARRRRERTPRLTENGRSRRLRAVCGRYTNALEFSQLKLRFEAADATFRPWTPAYNIAPSHGPGYEQPIVVAGPTEREVRLARFWLIPAWWEKPLNQLPAAFNARSEDAADKPFFRDALRASRCLVPATGWREFTGPRGKKQPQHFHFGHESFAFAGISATWCPVGGGPVDSFAILTGQPSPSAAAVHDRMPLVIAREHYDAWLDVRSEPAWLIEQIQAEALGRPVDIYPSDPVGNSVHVEGPEVLLPIPG